MGRGSGDIEFIRSTMGPAFAVVFLLFPRVFMCVCLSTAVLATTGYAFNEVFVYWFPNLGCSFGLMGLILALNLFGKRGVDLSQVVFVSAALLGLLVLIIAGIGASDSDGGEAFFASDAPRRTALRHLFSAMAVFIGFELSLLSASDRRTGAHAIPAMFWSLLGIGFILGSWGLVSMFHVPPERLADSTLPHMVAARVVLGQWGRVGMGIVVICGTCAAVNVLIAGISRMVFRMTQERLVSAGQVQIRGRPLIPPLLTGAGVFTMLGTGMAGKPILVELNVAAAWFWLAAYGAIHLTFQMKAEWMPKAWSVRRRRIARILSIGSLLGIGLALASVFFYLDRSEAVTLIEILVVALALSITLAMVLSQRRI